MHFSKNKERQLESMYPTTDDKEIAKILGLSVEFVRRKAEELGLEKEDSNEWTEIEIGFIHELYPWKSNKELSEIFGRSKMEIDHFAFRLGLSKSPEYFSDAIDSNKDRELINSWNHAYSKEAGNSRGNYVLSQILDYMFPHSQIFPEYPIGGLRLDFYLPTLNIGFEFDGIQHKEFNSFFYNNKTDFIKAQNRDYSKSEMCESMGISIVRFAHDEDLSLALVRAKIAEVV